MEELGADHSVTLAEVVHRDRDLFVEVCDSFVDLYQVAVKILDDSGHRLLDVPGRADLCQYIYDFRRCRQACIDIVGSIRSETPSFQTIDKTVCFSGAEYLTVPIHHATDVVGKVVFGPFLPAELAEPPADLLAYGREMDVEVAWNKTQRFRRLSQTLARKVARNLATVVEVMAFVGFKGQMTTDMHVESITEAYAELETKNRELEQSVDQLRTLNGQRSNFLARVSGELRHPLTNVIAYAEMMAEGVGGEVSDDQVDFLKTMINQGEQMMEVTLTMEELSLIERGQVDIVPEPLPISELLDEALQFGQRLGRRQDVDVEIFPPDSDLPDLLLDEERIRSVLHQVVGNAVKFTPAGGRVTLSATGAGDLGTDREQLASFIAITVADTGIGIGKEHHARLFEPFYTVHSGPDQAYQGTGVGLTIAKAYTEAHGGRIELESSPGAGATFTILLPIAGHVTRR